MTDARVLLALAAMVALVLLYVERGIPSAFAPLCAMGSAALLTVLFGCFGQLWLGGLLVYLSALAATGWLIWRLAVKKQKLGRLGYGFWFFIATGILITLLLWAKQPMFTDWDEFSLWGTGSKLMKLYNEFYVTAPIGWAWTQSQTPLIETVCYLFQFLGGGFAEWQCYVALDVFQFAAMAAVLAPLDNESRRTKRPAARHPNWNIALPIAVACVLTPFMFQHYQSADKVSEVYLTTLADLPMGIWFGAALCCWYAGKRDWRAMIPLCISLATLTLIKDIGMTLALVVCVLVLTDLLFERHDVKIGAKKRLGRAFSRFGAALASVAAAFGGWSIYMSIVRDVDRVVDGGGKLGIGLQEYPIYYLRELFSPSKSELFINVNRGMSIQFFSNKTTALSTGVMVALGILALVAAAALITRDKAHRRRCALFGVFSIPGFAAYYWLIAMLYIYMLRPSQAAAFDSYNRYVYPYYIGWLLCAVALLARSAVEAPTGKGLRHTWRPTLGRAALLALAAVMLLRMWQLVPQQYTVLGVHPDEYNDRRTFSAKVERLTQELDSDGRTFYVNTATSSGLGALGWFKTSYEMLPWQLDYSFGGGRLLQTEHDENGNTISHVVTAAELEQYLLESGCDRVYIDYIGYHDDDCDFPELYGALFTDNLQANYDGLTQLYEVVPQGGGVALTPILEG